ncbi:MAG: leucine-rich repeat domain-containing protein [Clostridia bacterium]|nr:leucine-rich repeat domain-containing protein [Clostridia bacterium]
MQNTDFTIENGVLKAYKGTSAQVIVPDAVTAVGKSAFSRDENLTSVTISDSVRRIGAGAFFGCENLTEITIPRSVQIIGTDAFSFCGGLRSIIVDPQNPAFYSDEDGVLYDKKQTTLIRYPEGKAQTAFAIPESVDSIGRFAFLSCNHLRSVTIPNSVRRIEEGAFRFCTGLASVTIPEGVTSIDDFTFEACTNLLEITIPKSVTRIGAFAFDGCMRLRTVLYSGSEADRDRIRINISAITSPFIKWLCGE